MRAWPHGFRYCDTQQMREFIEGGVPPLHGAPNLWRLMQGLNTRRLVGDCAHRGHVCCRTSLQQRLASYLFQQGAGVFERPGVVPRHAAALECGGSGTIGPTKLCNEAGGQQPQSPY